jgi:hypothetical protein
VPAADERGNRRWLVEPIGPNDVRIHVDVGEASEISQEARVALDRLLDELQRSDAEVFDDFPPCPELSDCRTFACISLGKCQNLSKGPCFAEVSCEISP